MQAHRRAGQPLLPQNCSQKGEGVKFAAQFRNECCCLVCSHNIAGKNTGSQKCTSGFYVPHLTHTLYQRGCVSSLCLAARDQIRLELAWSLLSSFGLGLFLPISVAPIQEMQHGRSKVPLVDNRPLLCQDMGFVGVGVCVFVHMCWEEKIKIKAREQPQSVWSLVRGTHWVLLMAPENSACGVVHVENHGSSLSHTHTHTRRSASITHQCHPPWTSLSCHLLTRSFASAFWPELFIHVQALCWFADGFRWEQIDAFTSCGCHVISSAPIPLLLLTTGTFPCSWLRGCDIAQIGAYLLLLSIHPFIHRFIHPSTLHISGERIVYSLGSADS